jgi:integrase
MKITQIPSGRWLVRVSYQLDGKTKELSKTFGKRREAERWQHQMEAGRDGGTLRPPTRDTVGQYLARWLRDLTGVGGRTREDYENIVRRYLGRTAEECRAITERYQVVPALGARRLNSLTPPQVREAMAALTRAGLAPRTVAYARAVLRRALNQAVMDGVIANNPAAGRGLVPKEQRAEMRVLAAGEVKRLLAETAEEQLNAL